MRNVGFCTTTGAWVAVDCCEAVHDSQWLQSIIPTRPEAVKTCAVYFIMPCLHSTMSCGKCMLQQNYAEVAVKLQGKANLQYDLCTLCPVDASSC